MESSQVILLFRKRSIKIAVSFIVMVVGWILCGIAFGIGINPFINTVLLLVGVGLFPIGGIYFAMNIFLWIEEDNERAKVIYKTNIESVYNYPINRDSLNKRKLIVYSILLFLIIILVGIILLK